MDTLSNWFKYIGLDVNIKHVVFNIYFLKLYNILTIIIETNYWPYMFPNYHRDVIIVWNYIMWWFLFQKLCWTNINNERSWIYEQNWLNYIIPHEKTMFLIWDQKYSSYYINAPIKHRNDEWSSAATYSSLVPQRFAITW